jgi:hypothetical protein
MAKKAKGRKPPGPAPLTADQYRRLADRLRGTRSNVYRVAESMFDGREFTENDWDGLTAKTGLFKCELCDEWKDTDERGGPDDVFCSACMDEIDGGEGEEGIE